VIEQTRAELLKMRSTRTTLGLVLGMVALIVLFALLTGLVSKSVVLAGAENQRSLLTVGSVAGIFAALTGILLVTGEFRFGTIRPTFLFEPRRSRVLAAKVVAGLLAGFIFGVAGEALASVIYFAVLSGRNIPFALSGSQLALLVLGTLAGVALWGAIGVGLGAIVHNQVAAVVGLLAWGFVAENLLFVFVPSVGRFGPTHAGDALAGLHAHHDLSPALGGAVLIAWAAALAVAGIVLTARRDVD
jgi:ABC-2 type transport system permease protein